MSQHLFVDGMETIKLRQAVHVDSIHMTADAQIGRELPFVLEHLAVGTSGLENLAAIENTIRADFSSMPVALI